MTMYQPGIPTGLVDLDVDYQSIQDNFQQLDTTYGVDHVAYSQAPNNGYHTAIHMVHNTGDPVAVSGTGIIYTKLNNDGINNDSTLYFETQAARILQLTRNFVPTAGTNGATFLPGGFILNWGTKGGATGGTEGNVNFTQQFPNACFGVLTQGLYAGSNDPSGSLNTAIKLNQTVGPFTSFHWKIFTNSSQYNGFWWAAIGR